MCDFVGTYATAYVSNNYSTRNIVRPIHIGISWNINRQDDS